jgi:hypothetical protein
LLPIFLEHLSDATVRFACRFRVRRPCRLGFCFKVVIVQHDRLGGVVLECAEVSKGNLQRPEALLMAQSTTLDTIFQDLTQLAYKHMNQLDAAERLLRLAFRAQTQSRATVETLGNMKNPPMVFARQANLTTGPQQVNNGIALPPAGANSGRNELLLEQTHAKTLDPITAGSPGRSNPKVAAVAKLNRTKDR